MLLTVAFLDVFHGDCTVVTFNELERKACIVIDGGEYTDAAKRLAAYLKNEQVEVIDLLVATHIDSDHINGLVNLIKSESHGTNSWNKGKKPCIRYYWGPKPDPNYTPPEEENHQMSALAVPALQMMDFVIKSVGQNQELSGLVKEYILDANNIYYPSLEDMPPLNIFNNVKLELMAPDIQVLDSEIEAKALSVSNIQTLTKTSSGPKKGRLKLKDLHEILALNTEEMAKAANRDANNQSIVFRLTPVEGRSSGAKGWTFLFAADAELESWENMGQTGVKENLPSKILKIAHHGSVNGTDEATFDIINPEYCIISVGQKHGLPDREALNIIKKDKNRKLFCTERNNHPKNHGDCIEKSNCPRRETSDFRSLRFTIDTDTGEAKNDMFVINTGTGEIEIKSGEIWCPEISW
ncbi:MAG: MBL fold metallo-hydrolase [Dehalococcoidia bacterium]|nr:MBL fold metallo-hydrolase [Dehalococcoidia bacterium]